MRRILLLVFLLLPAICRGSGKASESVYATRPEDPHAVYFTGQSGTDVSALLQETVNSLKERDNFGIVFIPEGTYYLSRTIYIPNAIRLIGYGAHRPEFVLADHAPGFQEPDVSDKGQARYLFWFTGGLVREGEAARDANAGTFYSAFSNIDIRLGKGNPSAVALRTHYAQHCFISFCDIRIDSGKAGVFDVGNEMDQVRFYGGDYGIITTKTSPSWQFTMLNTVFDGQRKAAIRSQEGGWIIRRMHVRNTPVAFEVEPDRHDKVFMEDCILEGIRDAAFLVSSPDVSPNQISILNTACRNVPVTVRFRDGRPSVTAPSPTYRIDRLTLGLHQDDMSALPAFRTETTLTPLKRLPALPENDIPGIPSTERWVNVVSLGAKGDGHTDDTQVFRQAVDQFDIIYVPQGEYVLSEPLVLKKQTALIGLNPISTQLVLRESTPAFSGFGAPVPLLETPAGGTNFVSGIGINTGAYNYRAVGIKWQAGTGSYLNDVKFLGIHGTMTRPDKTGERRIVRIPDGVSTPERPVNFQGKDKAWDNQHWSLWIAGGGGVFKDLWSASTYSASGLLITDTDIPGTMYEISVEHHVRNEVTLRNVSNWRFYGLQLEEELRESPDVQQIEIQGCRNLLFANLYLFRVIWIETPLAQAIRLWDGNEGLEFYNLHNFTQMRFTTDLTVHDVNTGLSVLPWELTHLRITGKETGAATPEKKIRRIATGFEFLEGMAVDGHGNLYFSEQRMRRIYRLDASTGRVSLVCDLPWQVLSLGCDTENRLLVCIKYIPQPGSAEPPARKLQDRSGTTFSWWGNEGFEPRVYAIDPEHPEQTVTELPRVPAADAAGAGRLLIPSHRWRDLHDFEDVVCYRPESFFAAPDGKTFIPEFYDLLRSSSMTAVEPGRPGFIADEYNHRTYRIEMTPEGWFRKPVPFAGFGEFSAAAGPEGRVCIADGFLYLFSADGALAETLRLPERPACVLFSGDRLFVAARTSLYEVKP